MNNHLPIKEKIMYTTINLLEVGKEEGIDVGCIVGAVKKLIMQL